MDNQTRTLLTESVRAVLAGVPSGSDLGPALAELGWDEVLGAEGSVATAILFGEQGRTASATRALDAVVLAELAPILGPPSPGRAVAHPHPGRACLSAPDAVVTPAAGGLLLGPMTGVHDVVFLVPASGGRVEAAVVPAGAMRARPIEAFDRSLVWCDVTPDDPIAGTVDVTRCWPAAVAAARRALAAEILGTCDTALVRATDHAVTRVQFGRPIGSFQAVRHRLAEAFAAVALAESLLEDAWRDGGPWAAALAKASAGQVQQLLTRHTLQVCGAIGLTEEHDLHRYVSRGMSLEALYGGQFELDEQLGRELLDDLAVGRGLPRVVEL